MPFTSTAGLERMNVTHSQFFSDWPRNSLSSTSTISGNSLIGVVGRYAPQKHSTSCVVLHRSAVAALDRQARPAGRRSARRNPQARQVVGHPSAAPAGPAPAAAITTFEPSFSPVPL